MNVETIKVENNGSVKKSVRCPECGSLLLTIKYERGGAGLVVKCRKCHKYIFIGIDET